MPATERDLSTHEIQAFPPWLDLPPGYIVNDWIAWEKASWWQGGCVRNPA